MLLANAYQILKRETNTHLSVGEDVKSEQALFKDLEKMLSNTSLSNSKYSLRYSWSTIMLLQPFQKCLFKTGQHKCLK